MRDTIEMAREVGFAVGLGSPALEKFERLIAMARADEREIVMNEPLTKEMWQRFEDEIRADEREACAKVCDDINAKYKWPDDVAERVASQWCADAIRARGETK
jgi:hypothetical protein